MWSHGQYVHGRHTCYADCIKCTDSCKDCEQWSAERLTGDQMHLVATFTLTASWSWSCRQGGHGSRTCDASKRLDAREAGECGERVCVRWIASAVMSALWLLDCACGVCTMNGRGREKHKCAQCGGVPHIHLFGTLRDNMV